jgi:hypothetical protein
MQSKLTLIGLYNYDNTALDNLSFPEGIDKDTAVSTILLRCGEFELLYPRLDFMHSMCDLFSKKHYWTFKKWIDAINIEYDPLNNYDRTESSSDTITGSDTHSGTDTTSGTTSGSTSPAQTTETNEISAFDASGYQPKEQNRLTVNAAGSDSSTSSGSMTHGEKIDKSESITHNSHLFGNIGVTTSQQMLQSELDIARFNLYDQIADIFCEEFCLMIY